MDDLRRRALLALEYELERAVEAPRRRTRALGFTLSFLGNFTDDRAAFDWFWFALADPGPARWHHANAALLAIYHAVGTERGRGPKTRADMPVYLTKADRKALRGFAAVITATERKHKEAAERAAENQGDDA